MAEFLSRCSIVANKNCTIPYREFLHRFQDRSERGMTHNILTDTKHRLVRLLVFNFYYYTNHVWPNNSTSSTPSDVWRDLTVFGRNTSVHFGWKDFDIYRYSLTEILWNFYDLNVTLYGYLSSLSMIQPASTEQYPGRHVFFVP